MNFKKTNSIVSLYDDVQWHWYREDNKRPIHKNVNFLSSSSLFHAHKIFHSSAARDRATEMKGSRRIAWKSNSLFRGNLGCWLNKLGNNENPFIEPSRCFYYPRNFSTHNCYLWSRHTKKNPNARAEYQRRKKKMRAKRGEILISILITHPPWSESIHILHRINSILLAPLASNSATPAHAPNSEIFIKNADELINFKSTPAEVRGARWEEGERHKQFFYDTPGERVESRRRRELWVASWKIENGKRRESGRFPYRRVDGRRGRRRLME